MNKRKVKNNYHNSYLYNPNYFVNGGEKPSWGEDFMNSFKGGISGGDAANALMGVAGQIGGAFGNRLSEGRTSTAGNAITTLGSTVGGIIPGPLGMGITAASGVLGGLTNNMFGSKLNEENINAIKADNAAMQNTIVDSSSNEAIMNQYRNQNFGEDFTMSDVGSDGVFSSKAERMFNNLFRERDFNLARLNRSYIDANENAKIKRYQDMMSQFKAYGGPIEMRTDAPMSPFGNRFAEGGGIHIKKANRGKFTDYCGGKVTTECINRGKNSPNPLTRKRAVFAANARNWNAFGGPLFTHGTEFSNGLTYIGNGDTHENNKLEGVPMGVDQQGNPNLVEEGEFIWNDYVFSNRLKVPKEVKEDMKLIGKDLTFADAVKQLQKESEERPNDPISKRGLEDGLNKLMMYQEDLRQNKNQGNKFDEGGYFNKDFTINVGNLLKNKEIKDSISNYMFGYKEPVETISNTKTNTNKSNLSYLRYAPALGSALGLGLTLANKPDYSRMETIMEEANRIRNYPKVKAQTISNYLTYNPFDTEYVSAQQKAQQAAALRALENTSSGNWANAQAGILASNYAGQLALGDIYKRAEEYNQAQREKIEGFNRGTNQFNAQQLQSANAQNQSAAMQANALAAEYNAKALAGMDAIDAARNASLSANLTGLFDNLGNIGIDTENRNVVKWMADRGLFGQLGSNRLYKKGGKLKRRKKGLTY